MPESKVRYALSIQVIESGALDRTFVNADCQVWIDEEHYTTINLVHLVTAVMPEQSHLQSAENYSAQASRVAARMIDEKLFEAISTHSLHLRNDVPIMDARPGLLS